MQKSNHSLSQSLSQFLLLILVAALGIFLGSIVENGVNYLIKSGIFSSWAFLDGFGWLKSILVFLSKPVVFILSIAIFVAFQKNEAKRKLTLQIIKNIFLLAVFSIGGGILGFVGGFFVADFKDSLEMKAKEWQLLDSPIRFTQIIGANSDMVWAQNADGQLYVWNFDCNLQPKCNQWVQTNNMDTGLQYPLAKKDNTCLLSGESGLHPLKDPPGKIVECGQLNFNFYVLLEDGTIWYWHGHYPGDGLPIEVYISAFVGIILGIIASMAVFSVSKS